QCDALTLRRTDCFPQYVSEPQKAVHFLRRRGHAHRFLLNIPPSVLTNVLARFGSNAAMLSSYQPSSCCRGSPAIRASRFQRKLPERFLAIANCSNTTDAQLRQSSLHV